MEFRYHIDPDTGLPHIYNHGVNEEEVEYILWHPAENRRGDDNSRIVIGRTLTGRCLKIICVPDADRKGIFVITAYDLTGKHLAAFRRRMRKRGLR